jgi:pyrimidine-nucleoside phosphorylase
LDKLEAIPGFRTDLDPGELKKQLKAIGVAMIGSTAGIAPADKLIYRLRDVTATVDSIPLIAASIMSKKLAEGLDGLVIDLKFGSGAFLPDYDDAKQLARTMINIGRRCGMKVKAVMTGMNNPLGQYVGNSLEVIESIEALKGRGSQDLMEVTYALGESMLRLARIKGGRALLERKIASGAALGKFRDIIRHQGGDVSVIEDYLRLPVSRRHWPVKAPKSGFIAAVDTYRIGVLATELGCGFRIYKKVGDRVRKEEKLAEVISDNRAYALAVQSRFGEVYKITGHRVKKPVLIRETL